MTADIPHSAINSIHAWISSVGTAVYDFQTLITGVLAIGAAYYAARPVWQQLKDSNLQTKIQHREILAIMMREAQNRFDRVSRIIDEPMSELNGLTHDQEGEVIPIDPHGAFAIEQQLHGELDWYLVGLKGTEASEIEAAKTALKKAMDELLCTLNDVHWCHHNEQHDEDHSISDDEWAAILVRSKEAETLAAEKASRAHQAIRALTKAQDAWIVRLRTRIAKLDLDIAAAS